MTVVSPFGGREPQLSGSAFLAPTSVLIGDVQIGDGVSIWFGAVLRADFAAISVEDGAAVQDNAVIHTARGLPTRVGANALIGHSAMLEGCVIGSGAVVGMGAIVLQRAQVGPGAMIAAGSVVPEGMVVPAGVLAAGSPAVVKKALSGPSKDWVATAAAEYHELRDAYFAEGRAG